MKGIIFQCIKELVTKQFGEQKWRFCLADAGIDKDDDILAFGDIPIEEVIKIIQSMCKNLGLTLEQVADVFGDFWVNVYTQRAYSHIYKREKNARNFLLNLNAIHIEVTTSLKAAMDRVSVPGLDKITYPRPPKFKYEWKDNDTLILTYISHRGLIDILVGCIKGLGKHYREEIKVIKIDDQKLVITFISNPVRKMFGKITDLFTKQE